MCDFVSYLFYDHPEEGWKLISKNLRSHSPSVSVLQNQFGRDFDRYAQVESQHESNYADDFQILLGAGLKRKNVTKEFVRGKILEIAPTMPDLIRVLILNGYEPDREDLDSAIEHGAWQTFKVLSERTEEMDPADVVMALLSSYPFNEEMFAKYAKGVELTEDHLEEAIRQESVEAVEAVLKRTKGKVTEYNLELAAEYGDSEVMNALATRMKPTEKVLMAVFNNEYDVSPILAKMKRIDLSDSEIVEISEGWMEIDDRIALAMKLKNVTQRGYALFNFIWDSREEEALALIKAGVKMEDKNIVEIIVESESEGAIELLRKYLLKNRPSKRVLKALDEYIENLDTWYEELLAELKKLRASMKRKWK